MGKPRGIMHRGVRHELSTIFISTLCRSLIMYKSVNKAKQKRLVLASNSPRRRELMAAFGQTVEVITPTSEETPPHEGELPEEFVLRMSMSKAKEVRHTVTGQLPWVLTRW